MELYVPGKDEAGYVDQRENAEARLDEIEKWNDYEWYPILLKLDEDIAKIEPNYNLVQLKAKFGSLCYYVNVSEESRKEVQALIRQAEIDCHKATHS